MTEHWPAFFDVALSMIPPLIAVLINRTTGRLWPPGHEPWLLIAGIALWTWGCTLGVGAWYHIDRPGDDVNPADVIRAVGTLWTSILLLGAGAFFMLWSVTWRMTRYFEHQRLLSEVDPTSRGAD